MLASPPCLVGGGGWRCLYDHESQSASLLFQSISEVLDQCLLTVNIDKGGVQQAGKFSIVCVSLKWYCAVTAALRPGLPG